MLASDDDSVAELPEVSRDQLIVHRRLGEGNFSYVYYGELCKDGNNSTKNVAVKKHRNSKELTEFIAEAQLMRKLNHENILEIIATTNSRSHPNRIYLLSEFCDEGNLETFASAKFLNQSEAQKIAFEIAKGLHYLKVVRIIHRDLAPRNILIHKGVAKISDFGLARAIPANSDRFVIPSNALLPPDVRAPENHPILNAPGIHVFKSDVWAYGYCLYALYNQGIGPWEKFSANDFRNFVENLSIPSRMPQTIADIMRHCFIFDEPQRNGDDAFKHQSQIRRISIEDIYELLQNI